MPRGKKGTSKIQVEDKKCNYCHKTKRLVDFYLSKNPLHSADERVPICKDCITKSVLNKDGSINEEKFKEILRLIDRPYYTDTLETCYRSFGKEYDYMDPDKIKYYGKQILGKYFSLICLPRDLNKTYIDSVNEGFVHKIEPRKTEKQLISEKYDYLQKNHIGEDNLPPPEDNEEVKWSKKDKQNMKYAISIVGYDPYEDIGLSEADRKYCYNMLAGYCDTEGVSEDGHKLQSVIEMTMLYCQSKKITEAMNLELKKRNVDDAKIQKLTSSKSSILSSIATIAKDNNISSNYNKNSRQGQNSLTLKMKEMEEDGFEGIAVNLFDIKTSEAFKQIDEISNENIANQLTLDNNEYTEIIKEQREMIQNYSAEIDELKEENRILKNKIIDLENNGKRR